MDPNELLLTAARGLAVYAFMLLVIRLLGKRTVGNFTAFDLLVALMLGEVVDEIIYGDVSMVEGGIVIAVIAAAKYVTNWLTYNHGLNKVFEGVPTIVVKEGELQRTGLKSELMNEKEIMAALRLHGIDDMREVKLATLEVDGEVSILKEDWAETVQKKDLGSRKKVFAEPVPEEKRTDSPRALGHSV